MDDPTRPASLPMLLASFEERLVMLERANPFTLPPAMSALDEIAESFSTTLTVGAFSNLGSATTFTPPASWNTYDMAVIFSAKFDVPTLIGVAVALRCSIDADTGASMFWLGDNPFGTTEEANAHSQHAAQGLSGAVDVQVSASVQAITSGTVTFTAAKGQIICTRVT